MFVENPARANGEELEWALEKEIVRRTWGRIRRLRVKLTESQLTVRGYTSTYYAKQLALSAVRDVNPWDPVDLDIQVVNGSHPFPVQGRQDS